MATRPWKLTGIALAVALLVWIWGLAGLLLGLRWLATEHPEPTPLPLLPYGQLRVGVDASYPPFATATDDGLYGLEIDLGRALAERLNVPLHFTNMGFDGLYDSLRADQVDVVIAMLLIDPARWADVRYTTPYFNAGLVLVTNGDSTITGMNDVAGRRLALEYGSDADLTAQAWARRILPFEVRPYEVTDYALEAVRLNQADAALVDAASARLYQRLHSGWKTRMAYVTDRWYAAAVRADRGRLWAAVNAAIDGMWADGTLDAIIARWL